VGWNHPALIHSLYARPNHLEFYSSISREIYYFKKQILDHAKRHVLLWRNMDIANLLAPPVQYLEGIRQKNSKLKSQIHPFRLGEDTA